MTGILSRPVPGRGDVVEVGLYRIRMTPYGGPLWFLTLQLPMTRNLTRFFTSYGPQDVLAFTVQRSDGQFGHLGVVQAARVEGEQIMRYPIENHPSVDSIIIKQRPAENITYISRFLNECRNAGHLSPEVCQKWTQMVRRPPKPLVIPFNSPNVSQAALDEANLGQADLITLRQFPPWLSESGAPMRQLTAIGLPAGRHSDLHYAEVAKRADVVIKWIPHGKNGSFRVPNRYCWETNNPIIRRLKDGMSSPFNLSKNSVGRPDNSPTVENFLSPAVSHPNIQHRQPSPHHIHQAPQGPVSLASEAAPDFADLFDIMLSLKDNPPKMADVNPFEMGVSCNPRMQRPHPNSRPPVHPGPRKTKQPSSHPLSTGPWRSDSNSNRSSQTANVKRVREATFSTATSEFRGGPSHGR